MGFLCCLIPGAEGGIPALWERGPSKPATGGWKQKGVKKECQRTSCIIGTGLSQFGHPGELQSIPALQFRSQLQSQSLVWLQGQPWCGLKQLLGTCPLQGLQRQAVVWARGTTFAASPLGCSCQPLWELAIAAWDSNKKGSLEKSWAGRRQKMSVWSLPLRAEITVRS